MISEIELIETMKKIQLSNGENMYDAIVHITGSPMKDNTGRIVSDILLELGVPQEDLGYLYIRESILLNYKDINKKNMGATRHLYPLVAKKFDTTYSRVERAIRHAIEVTWDRGNVDVFYKYFGNSIDPMRGKPTNTQLISTISNVLRERLGLI